MSTQSHSSVSLPSFDELPRLSVIDSPSTRPLSLSSDSSPCTSPGSDNGLKITREKQENLQARGESYKNATTINMLPDDVLLEIFDRHRKNHQEWLLLVHVCRRWRQITFASPLYLNLRILCRDGTLVRKNLGIWPPIPIIVQYGTFSWVIARNDEDNAIAALEHPDRVFRVKLRVTGLQFSKISTVMREPFPVLTDLSIFVSGRLRSAPSIPNGFLGGFAPCLQKIELHGIPFPALPTLLLSASDLVVLILSKIPPTGYISPDTMVASLAALPKLAYLRLDFQVPAPHPDRMHPPPVTRTALPVLTHLSFFGDCEYSEDFVARIDAPQLHSLSIYYTNPLVRFGVPQLSEFINRSEHLKQTLPRSCQVINYYGQVKFSIGSGICVHLGDWQLLHTPHVLGWVSPVLSNMVHFSIKSESVAMEDFAWLQLLRPLSSVQTLFASTKIAGNVSRFLEYIAGVMITVLPALDLLCLEDQPASSVDKFIAVRRNSDHPVTVVTTQREFDERLELYP